MNCVYRASSVEQADIIVAWLAAQDIAAVVNNRNVAGECVGLAVGPRGIEVSVADSEEAAKAEVLLKAHLESIKMRPVDTSEKMISILCTECGRPADFPEELYGTVQNCPSCGRNVDVVDPPKYC
jgi:hypothetical protein